MMTCNEFDCRKTFYTVADGTIKVVIDGEGPHPVDLSMIVRYLNSADQAMHRLINQSAEIEQRLLDMSAGKRPLPTKEECRFLALALGTPKSYWSDKLKEAMK